MSNGEVTERGASVVGGTFPLTVHVDGGIAWLAAHRPWIDEQLTRAGALVFEGAGIMTAGVFDEAARTLAADLFTENGEHTPIVAGGHAQRPVFYAADRELLWHNENSFNAVWPHKLMFACEQPATTGGETTLVDSRAVLAAIDPALRRRFQERQIMYRRTFGLGVGLTWQQVYRTDDRDELARRCRAAGVRIEWDGAGVLRTEAVRPAIVQHSRSGEWSWFNQAQHWHVACLDARTRAALTAMFVERDLPRSCCYGDGSPIEESAMTEILGVYRSLEVGHRWQQGDLMIVDNVLAAHGRRPFTGDRRLMVALGEPTRFTTATGQPK